MKTLCRIFFIFFTFIVFSCTNVFADETCDIKENISVISAVKQIDTDDILNSKNDESVLQNISRNGSAVFGIRKSNISFDFGPNNFINVIPAQFINMLNYIYSLAYLENKSKVNFSLIFSEVLPNAP